MRREESHRYFPAKPSRSRSGGGRGKNCGRETFTFIGRHQPVRPCIVNDAGRSYLVCSARIRQVTSAVRLGWPEKLASSLNRSQAMIVSGLATSTERVPAVLRGQVVEGYTFRVRIMDDPDLRFRASHHNVSKDGPMRFRRIVALGAILGIGCIYLTGCARSPAHKHHPEWNASPSAQQEPGDHPQKSATPRRRRGRTGGRSIRWTPMLPRSRRCGGRLSRTAMKCRR